ncbi:winged helix DNA-binding domain-containing protein [Iamia sp. SCSIO 61187]|uniref:DNA glycosylase AlkZ-like family protein n=1 Tax=Iamia sp. SCSIO 61187 TaxID=2722752 RepID=UPI001C635E26|nr:crosslink repair DNA glycosylase YcaQ family protein [Iamia sp. SCSIO 61187]QYG92300.1 winged helix DNA-binding domain-containing protein [Iamia sp. SCSIO 61187]
MSRTGGAVPDVGRDRVLAHRVAAHQLDRAGPTTATALAIVDLGVQDTPAGSAAQSLAARLPDGAAGDGAGGAGGVDTSDGRRWTSVWGVRGAPHVHRRGDLRALAAALWPIDADDAAARLAGTGTSFRKSGVDSLEVVRLTAAAYGEVVTDEMPKGEASAALTERVPDVAVSWCRGCQAHHLSDQLMRVAALPGGARLVPGGTATLAPIPGWPGLPEGRAGTEDLITAYLTLNGPTPRGDVATYLGTTQKALADAWPDDLEEVTVDGRKAVTLPAVLDALAEAPAPRVTRLLPRGDPWLLARDRTLTVPDKAHHKVLWPMLGHPGGVLVDGEVVGAWRTRATATRLDVTITPFTSIPKARRAEVETEARLVATLRDRDDVRVSWGD